MCVRFNCCADARNIYNFAKYLPCLCVHVLVVQSQKCRANYVNIDDVGASEKDVGNRIKENTLNTTSNHNIFLFLDKWMSSITLARYDSIYSFFSPALLKQATIRLKISIHNLHCILIPFFGQMLMRAK